MNGKMPIEGQYTEADLNTHPPVNPATHRPYDSVVYFHKDSKGNEFLRVAIYDAGQIYPEYVVAYSRGQVQPPMPMGQQINYGYNSGPQYNMY